MLRSAFLCASALLVLLASFACANVQTESKTVNGQQSVESQQKQIADTILNKGKLSEEITQKFASFREGCYPRPNQQGCRCVERDVDGHDLEKLFDTNGQCKVVSAQEEQRQLNETILNKGAVNEELKQKFSTPFRDGCFPRPNKSGCRCVEKDMDGHDQEKLFDTEAECTVSAPSRVVRAARVQQERVGSDVAPASQDRTQQKTAGTGVDPVAERARQNYAAVLNELKNKFAGLREGCYPRPKGCLCVIGKDATGREITERRMNDADCKCRPGERSRDCPARGA